MSVDSGRRHKHLAVIILPAQLNALSAEMEVVCMHKDFLLYLGYLDEFFALVL